MKRGVFRDNDTGREYFSGYSGVTLFDWDLYFESIVQIYMGWPGDYIKNAVLIFLDHQKESGIIPRSVPGNIYHDEEHAKPFLAQTINLFGNAYGETNWIDDGYFTKLKKYLDYWLNEMDLNNNGLSEWMSAPHTGMDNQHERAGWWKDRFCEGVDLNCYLYRELIAFSRIAKKMGKEKEAQYYSQKADSRKSRISEKMWDKKDGFFYDIDNRTEEKIRVKSASSFTALWSGIATPEQAERLVSEHLVKPGEFWSPYPVAVLSKSEKGYSRTKLPDDLGCSWRANTWIPTNYMIYHGLKTYGYNQLASRLARATVNLVQKSGNREYYDSETGAGCGLNPFWGWTLLAYFLPYEEDAEFDITGLS